MHLLQSLLLPRPGLPEDLYLRIVHPKHRRSALAAIDPQAGAVTLERKETLSTDTFFGCFYVAYWARFTPVRDLSLRLRLEGRGTLRVFEDTGQGITLIHAQKIESDGTRPVVAPLKPAIFAESPFLDPETRAGRLFAEFRASEPTRILEMSYMTDTPPLQQVRLSVGLCTFNQEEFFQRTLERLSAFRPEAGELTRVHVVNQGRPFASARLRELLAEPRFHLVEQRNLGGCGGFTRSLIEALASAEAGGPDAPTHHLMMDDDIVLDERVIDRAMRFLGHVARDVVLGAGMLDMLVPTRMYEAGATLREDNTIVPYCHNVDMADPGQLHHFNRVPPTDYNAWWFCVIPLDAARRVGLPPPIFIRGDDFEYGQRLARAGVPTVTLPGIAVWHEPFYAKPMGWQAYYDLRNRLIFGATYADKVDRLSLLRMVNLLITPVLTHQYMIAALRMQAVRDFLNGPERLFAASPEETHDRIMRIARDLAPERLDDAAWKLRPGSPVRPMPAGKGQLARLFLKGMIAALVLPHRRQRKILLDVDANPANTLNTPYVLTNGPRSFHLLLSPRRGLAARQLFSGIRLLLAYRRRLNGASAAWEGGIGTYRDPAYWHGLLKLGEPQTDDSVTKGGQNDDGNDRTSHVEGGTAHEPL